ncbi:hypothetical protein H310_14724 [Aphanomyces invadans]|uniref:Uncharacterized protein n=1 Tax=Aphanomyces invadans TaxID=157072 RepID=A0A024T925_9STRA|nr:hypothetical protein H310_14724 [Aphanomyces invadans]ETV90479.1 hypothetical protein H310_14724 [Aphanomyces invadans]|eukprot:XP_008880867.1 hypothetical protein H310_14724 [Aphanomyces invadans]
MTIDDVNVARIPRRQRVFRRATVRKLEEESPPLAVGAIVAIAVGAVILGILACICIRRVRLENRRKKTQMRLDRALLEGAQCQDAAPPHVATLPDHQVAPPLYPTLSSSSAPKCPKNSDTSIHQTPIEHVVGSSDSDDFVIMGTKGKPPLIPNFAKANKTGMHLTSSTAYMHSASTKPTPAPGIPGSHTESMFVASFISDDIAMLQSTRGGSFDAEVVEHMKGRAV